MSEPELDDPIALGKDEEDDTCWGCDQDAPNCVCDEEYDDD